MTNDLFTSSNKSKPWMVELSRSENFRTEGQHGKSRVCARRAVGFALAARYPKNSIYRSMNAMNLIREARAEEDLPEEIAGYLDEMVARVDESFEIPKEIDLIASARRIIQYFTSEEYE